MWIFELAQSTCQDTRQAVPKVGESHWLGRDMAEEEDNIWANITEEVAIFSILWDELHGNISLPLWKEMSWCEYQEAEEILIDNVQYIKANIWREIPPTPPKGILWCRKVQVVTFLLVYVLVGFFGACWITVFCNQFKILLAAFVNPVTIAYLFMHFATFYFLNVGKELWTLCLTRSKNLALLNFIIHHYFLQKFYS